MTISSRRPWPATSRTNVYSASGRKIVCRQALRVSGFHVMRDTTVSACLIVHRNRSPVEVQALRLTGNPRGERYHDVVPLMRRSFGWAMRLPAPTKVAAGWSESAPLRGTPPSPSMKPSPLASLTCETIDHEPLARTEPSAEAVSAATRASAVMAATAVRATSLRTRPEYVHGVWNPRAGRGG